MRADPLGLCRLPLDCSRPSFNGSCTDSINLTNCCHKGCYQKNGIIWGLLYQSTAPLWTVLWISAPSTSHIPEVSVDRGRKMILKRKKPFFLIKSLVFLSSLGLIIVLSCLSPTLSLSHVVANPNKATGQQTFCQDGRFVRKTFCQDRLRRFVRNRANNLIST